MQRAYIKAVHEDLSKKIVLLSGPRQVGKTTLSKMIFDDYEYYNYDFVQHRLDMEEMSWRRNTDLVIFDELHKKRGWKSWLKGIYDVNGIPPRILVTGSARLNTWQRLGDSLAGRYFQHRLHPLDIKELKGELPPDEAMPALLETGGFPEPFINGTKRYYNRWRRSHLDVILRQDVVDMGAVTDIAALETLVTLLRKRVGTQISYTRLARDLGKDPKTIKNWIELLESLYVLFRVTPWSHNIARSLLKDPKIYFYDIAAVDSDEGTRFENLVACALAKELDRMADTEGIQGNLHYLRTKDGRELDFAIELDERLHSVIEVKLSDDTPSPHFVHFNRFFKNDIQRIQLVKTLRREKEYPTGVKVCLAHNWLADVAFDT